MSKFDKYVIKKLCYWQGHTNMMYKYWYIQLCLPGFIQVKLYHTGQGSISYQGDSLDEAEFFP